MLTKRLKLLRNQEKLTQAQMAEKVGVARTTYAMYEQGNREPDNKTLARIADYFGVSTDYLLGRTDIPEMAGSKPAEPKEVPLHVRMGIPDEKYEELTPYYQKVLDWFLQRKDLAFHDRPEDIVEELPKYAPIYEKLKDKL
ncbi:MULTISPECIES: helix-turn-helix domain-containing protein [Bhargavaea]|uniref:Helix-turn-helix domain-containing protein n=1 Tax=Bhargavaea changchunensis TaxID=2134037 RepID=A0ABW2NEK9_9BACL|nr:helix-turn-helix transcriptional regulator [Bhargavaea sp. CC-171006]